MKEAHQAKVEAQLAEWRAMLGVLEAKAMKATAQVRIDMGNHMDELKKLESSGLAHLEELKKATAGAWDDVKSTAEKKWDALSSATTTLWAKLT